MFLLATSKEPMQEHQFRERNQEPACSYPPEQNAVPLQCLFVRSTVLKESVEKWGAKNFRTLLSHIIFRPTCFDRKHCSRFQPSFCFETQSRGGRRDKTSTDSAFPLRPLHLCVLKIFAGGELGSCSCWQRRKNQCKNINSENEIKNQLAVTHPNKTQCPFNVSLYDRQY